MFHLDFFFLKLYFYFLVRMGYYYLGTKKFSCAKPVFVTGCKYSPSPRMWKGAGIACLRVRKMIIEISMFNFSFTYLVKHKFDFIFSFILKQLKEYEEAEIAFSEANYLDNRDSETWGYLALVNGLLGREDVLKHCLLEAKKVRNCFRLRFFFVLKRG